MSTPLEQALAECSSDDKATVEKAFTRLLDHFIVKKDHTSIEKLLVKIPNDTEKLTTHKDFPQIFLKNIYAIHLKGHTDYNSRGFILSKL